MAKNGVAKHDISIPLFCEVYGISETCYRYYSKRDSESIKYGDRRLAAEIGAYNREGLGIKVRLLLPTQRAIETFI